MTIDDIFFIKPDISISDLRNNIDKIRFNRKEELIELIENLYESYKIPEIKYDIESGVVNNITLKYTVFSKNDSFVGVVVEFTITNEDKFNSLININISFLYYGIEIKTIRNTFSFYVSYPGKYYTKIFNIYNSVMTTFYKSNIVK